MGIRRKGSRPITVDGIKYRWLTVGEDIFGARLYVELYDKPAQKLESSFSHIYVLNEKGEDGCGLEHFGVVSPGVVEQTVRRALKLGWKPEQRGENFFISEDQVLEPIPVGRELKNYAEDFHSKTDAPTRRIYCRPVFDSVRDPDGDSGQSRG